MGTFTCLSVCLSLSLSHLLNFLSLPISVYPCFSYYLHFGLFMSFSPYSSLFASLSPPFQFIRISLSLYLGLNMSFSYPPFLLCPHLSHSLSLWSIWNFLSPFFKPVLVSLSLNQHFHIYLWARDVKIIMLPI